MLFWLLPRKIGNVYYINIESRIQSTGKYND